ncbi:acyl-CoA-binding protein (ACBP)/diazepam binding inhibitor (DBI)/endozepine (EP) [Xanthoria parietina]
MQRLHEYALDWWEAKGSQPRQSQSLVFQKAVKEVQHLKARPTDDEMLELYALYKQGTQDPPFAIAARPGVFDLVVFFSLGHLSLSEADDPSGQSQD